MPAAAPEIVASCITGKTLFVPVDIGTMAASGQVRATIRLVPSPPSTSSVVAPASRMARTALAVSAGLVSNGPMSRNSNSAPTFRFSTADCEMRKRSGTSRKRTAPDAAAPTTARAIWFCLSTGFSRRARAARRRTSSPDIGLAMMPTVGITASFPSQRRSGCERSTRRLGVDRSSGTPRNAKTRRDAHERSMARAIGRTEHVVALN